MVTPVSNVLVLITILLYADDADLYAFDKGSDSTEDAVVKI